MRSPAATTRSIGPSVNEPRSTTAPSSRATTSPLRPADATVRRSCHGSRGLSTVSSRSIAFSVRAARPASCSVWLILNARMFLSCLVATSSPSTAPASPTPARAGPARRGPCAWLSYSSKRSHAAGRAAVALVEVGLPAAAEAGGPVGELVELDDVGDGAGEERAVVADEHARRPASAGDPALEPVEPGEVEVVGRLVEQEHVEAGQQQGGQPGPCRLAARQRRASAGRAGGAASPRSAQTWPTRASRSAPPSASQRSRASE